MLKCFRKLTQFQVFDEMSEALKNSIFHKYLIMRVNPKVWQRNFRNKFFQHGPVQSLHKLYKILK